MLTLNEIAEILKNERKTGEIQPLPKDFYRQAEEILKVSGTPDSGEYSSASKITTDLKERRTQKLMIYLAYNKPLPHPIPSEDEDLYIQIKRILGKSVSEQKSIKIRITKKVPQVITPAGNSIGPFEQNETATLSNMEDVKFIVENKLGEIAN
jgi:preprotein translocase subunit Sss1